MNFMIDALCAASLGLPTTISWRSSATRPSGAYFATVNTRGVEDAFCPSENWQHLSGIQASLLERGELRLNKRPDGTHAVSFIRDGARDPITHVAKQVQEAIAAVYLKALYGCEEKAFDVRLSEVVAQRKVKLIPATPEQRNAAASADSFDASQEAIPKVSHYRVNQDGRYCFFKGGVAEFTSDPVAILYYKASGAILKHGDPAVVRPIYQELASAYLDIRMPEDAGDLGYIEGRFALDDLNGLLAASEDVRKFVNKLEMQAIPESSAKKGLRHGI